MSHTRYLLTLACCLLLLAGGGVQLLRYKTYAARLATELAAQQQALTALTAERDALKNKKPEAVACPAPIPDREPQSEVQAVLEPQEETPDRKTSTDILKKRYENILVSYFVLRQCGKNAATDYHIIISALSQEMASVNAPGRLQYDILTSAQGSYKELYSGNGCDAANLTALETDYRRFIDSTSAQFLPR